MTEEEIRIEILKIQYKYYTPISKIAKAVDIDRSLLSRMLSKKFEKPMYINVLSKLEVWLKERM